MYIKIFLEGFPSLPPLIYSADDSHRDIETHTCIYKIFSSLLTPLSPFSLSFMISSRAPSLTLSLIIHPNLFFFNFLFFRKKKRGGSAFSLHHTVFQFDSFSQFPN